MCKTVRETIPAMSPVVFQCLMFDEHKDRYLKVADIMEVPPYNRHQHHCISELSIFIKHRVRKSKILLYKKNLER